jgi:hypothetical protein
MICWKCGTEIEVQPAARILTRDCCPSCDYDLHVCLNCRFYDPNAHNECRETQAEWVQGKDKANYCDYFEPGSGSGPEELKRKSPKDAKTAFDKLFKD